MREGTAPATVRRADYAAPAYRIAAVELTFDLDPKRTLVASKLSIERAAGQAPGTPLRLQGEELTPLRVLADGEPVAFRAEPDGLVIDNPPEAERFVLEVRNTCSPEANLELSGLYASGAGLYTQCEAEGFRRITYFLDRPDVMAVYTVTLRADNARYPVLLSNGNLVEQGELEGGRHFAKWHDPFPKPSYLFALVAGNLVAREQRITSRSGKEHLLQIYVAPGDLDRTEHAMNALVASVVWDEARFNLPLDLERFMIVAVSDFNSGAMENKGLNLFNSKFVLATPATATDFDFDNIERIVAHEYFHNWTGNRITCRDWFQLSLKEGLTVYRDQEFGADMSGSASARAVRRIEDVKRLRDLQFSEDAGPMAHPVRPDEYAAIQNFYTATVYEKGAEVVRMMATLVGREGFARGMALYFQRHDGQAVTCDDFAQAIADANPGSALATHLEAFKRWYAQAGTPTLQARGHYDAEAQRYTLTLRQHGSPTPGQPHKLPCVMPVRMGLLSQNGRALPLTLDGEDFDPARVERVLVLDQAEQSFVFTGVGEPPVPSLLRGFSAPVRLDDGLDEDALMQLFLHDSDAFNRWEAGQRLMRTRLLAAVAADAPPVLDTALVQALDSLLRDPILAPAFKALAVQPPEEEDVAAHLSAGAWDPQRVHRVCEQFKNGLAEQLRETWEWVWAHNAVTAGYAPTPDQAGARALQTLALQMLCRDAARSGDAVWPGRAYQRVKDASNMTERMAGLQALVGSHAALAAPALERFHAQHRHDPLLLDKWFQAQATANEPLPGSAAAGSGLAAERVRALMQHPDFTLKNPNRARALLQAFCQRNPAGFHRADGAGYAVWADAVLALDAFNPMMASRLARQLERWRLLAEPMRSQARAAVERVAAQPGLSADTREIVSKALAD